MNTLRRSIKNALSSVAGNIVPAALGFLSTPILLHRLGEDGFGLQNLVGVITGYFMIMDLGLDISLTKLLAEYNAKSDTLSVNKLLNMALQMYALVGGAGFILICLFADYFATAFFALPGALVDSGRQVFYMAAVGFLFSMLVAWGQAAVNGIQRYDLSNTVRVLSTISGTVLGLAIVLSGFGVVEYVFCRVLVIVVSGCYCYFMVRNNIPGFRISFELDWPIFLRVSKYSGYGFVLRIGGFFSSGLDRALIAKWLSVASLPIYVIPSMIVTTLGSLVVSMMAFMMPMASDLFATGQVEKFRDFFVRSFRFNAGISAIAVCPLIALGVPVIRLWIGEPMAEKTQWLLIILLLANFLSMVSVAVPNNVVIGVGRIDRFTVYSVTRAFALAGGFLSMKYVGILGAAYAFYIALLVDMAFLVYCLRRVMNENVGRFFVEHILPAILLGVVLALGGFAGRQVVTGWVSLAVVETLLVGAGIALAFYMHIFGDTERRAMMLIYEKVTMRQA